MTFSHVYISSIPATWCLVDGDFFEVHTILPDGEYPALDQADLKRIAREYDLDSAEVAGAYDYIAYQTSDSAIDLGFVLATGYCGWLSAPGFHDHSDPVIGFSREEVAQQLLDRYFGGDVEDMDEDEIKNAVWLANLAGDESALAKFEKENKRRANMSSQDDQYRNAFQEGMEAFQANKLLSSNPYSVTDNRGTAWLSGWLAAKTSNHSV